MYLAREISYSKSFERKFHTFIFKFYQIKIIFVRLVHDNKITANMYEMSLIVRKPVFGVSDLVLHSHRRWLET